MWPSGGRAAAVRPNSGQPPPGLAGERHGGDLGALGVRFGGLVWAETRPAMAVGVHAGCLRQWPPVGSDAARSGHKSELAALERLP
jgi:hypothetical protein